MLGNISILRGDILQARQFARDNLELAQPWLEHLSTTCNAQQMDKASEFHPQLALYVELQVTLLECALGQVTAAEQRLCGLIEYAQQHDCVVIEQSACVYLCMLLLEQGAYDCAAKQLVQALQLAQGGALLAFQ